MHATAARQDSGTDDYILKASKHDFFFVFPLQWLVSFLWCCAFATGLALVFAMDVYDYLISGTQPPAAASAAFNTFGRSAWAAALGWLIFACFHGYGGERHVLL